MQLFGETAKEIQLSARMQGCLAFPMQVPACKAALFLFVLAF